MSTEYPKVCFDRVLPDVESIPGVMRIALLKSKLWVSGTTLRVAFASNATLQQRKEVQVAYEELMQYVNIDFRLAVQGGQNDIRITFDPTKGAWSYIGQDILGIQKNMPTMNLGFNQSGTYLHELGHTLGAIHEHQNPVGGIKWNKEQVYRDLSGPPNNWDKQTIDHNMFEAYSQNQVNGSVVDPASIMMYAIPSRWTTDGFSTSQNSALSLLDKQWLSKQYPKQTDPGMPPVGPGEETTKPIPISVIDLRAVEESIGKPGERDLYAFTMETAGKIRIEAIGETSVVLRLLGPNTVNNLIAQTNNVGMDFNAQIFQSLNGGKYFVQVSHANQQGTGSYKLRILRFMEGDSLLFL